MGPAYLLWRCIDVFVVYLCDPSDLSNIINVIYLANFNHHLSCIAALHKGLYVQQVHTNLFNSPLRSLFSTFNNNSARNARDSSY